MPISLEAIAVLDAIDRKGSFASAAEALYRVPSAITYTIQKLEQDLGVILFNRSGHKAHFTEAGRELLEQGRHLLMASAALEERVKQAAKGWETELRIAVSDLIPSKRIYSLVKEFYDTRPWTQLRLHKEVYGGCWDALMSGRADLVIGAPGEGPSGGGYTTSALGAVEFDFVVAPDHPLAQAPEPLSAHDILQHRAVSAADSSRNLLPRSSGLLSGQDVLTVPDMQEKQVAHRLGLGVGYLPRHLLGPDVRAKRLIVKQVEETKAAIQLLAAWRTSHKGRALQWFLAKLKNKEVVKSFLTEI